MMHMVMHDLYHQCYCHDKALFFLYVLLYVLQQMAGCLIGINVERFLAN